MKQPRGLMAGLLLAGLATLPLHAQHGHLNVGALSQTQDSPLHFVNGADFAESSGYVRDLPYSDTGRYAGTFNANITLTAFNSFDTNGTPLPNGPAAGSFIRAEILSVSGPAGGQFSYWENDGQPVPLFTLVSGFSGASPSWALSDASRGAGLPDGNAFGHLHGRRFSVDQPGDYLVTFRAFDASANGAGGGPIHTPTEPLTIRFQAVPEPSTLGLAALGAGAALLVRRRRK